MLFLKLLCNQLKLEMRKSLAYFSRYFFEIIFFMIESNKRKNKFLKCITLLEKLYKFNLPFYLLSPLPFSDSLSARKFVVRRSWSLKFWLESSEIGRETRRSLSWARSFTWDRWRSDPITRIATLLSSPQLYLSSRSHPGCLHSFMRFHNFKFHQQTHWLKRACG